MNILIAGSDLNAVLLAQYLKQSDKYNDIYVTDSDSYSDCGFISVNIKENDINSISDFIKYNQVEFTIATSPISIINGIADILKQEGFSIFAPSAEAARITFFNSVAKKIMYKLKINTPKFGIFDRENLAVEYVRNSKFPLIIRNDLSLNSTTENMYNTFSAAKRGIQEIFENNNEKIIIENFIDAQTVYIYFVTDGYNALPLINLERINYKEYEEINTLTETVSDLLIRNILNQVIYPLLDDIKQYAGLYIGILGLKLKIKGNNYSVLEFFNGFQSCDMQAFISILDDDITSIYKSAANGQLDRDKVNLSDLYSYTIAINKNDLITNNEYENEDDDFIISEDKNKYVITSTASTLNYAKEKLYNYLTDKCEKKLLNEIIKNNKEKEIRV